jgi:hypothetical protein
MGATLLNNNMLKGLLCQKSCKLRSWQRSSLAIARAQHDTSSCLLHTTLFALVLLFPFSPLILNNAGILLLLQVRVGATRLKTCCQVQHGPAILPWTASGAPQWAAAASGCRHQSCQLPSVLPASSKLVRETATQIVSHGFVCMFEPYSR